MRRGDGEETGIVVTAAASAIRGLAPDSAVRPRDVGELSGFLRDGSGPVVPVGGGTRLGLGGPLAADRFTALDLTGLDRVIEHAVDDLTITLEPGVTLARLSALLREKGQWIPLDPAFPEEATVGGLVATAAWGPLRPFGETPRRHLIGIAVVDGKGVLRRAGGRLVKNVAGYDMMKLHTGALGTLGVIVELSFRVRPLPEAERLLLGRAADTRAIAALLADVNRSDLEPSTFVVYDTATAAELHGDAALASPLGVAAGFLGFSEDVTLCVDEFSRMAKAAGITLEHRLEDAAAADFRRRLAWHPNPGDLELRAHALPSATFDLLHELSTALEPGADRPLFFIAHPTVGAVRVLAPSGNRVAAGGIRSARETIGKHGGHLIVETCPDALAREVDVWGSPGPGGGIMAGLRKALDPDRRFNPGRFAEGA
jgi:glycolate oxidase FAD binding subunit